MNISPEKYLVVPVGADEDIFKFSAMAVKTRPEFNVFYYGNMLPLHGLKFVCDSAVEVAKNDPSISFTIIGGKSETKALVDKSVRNGAKIEYRPWVDYKELPEYIAKSSLCLGGPFGNTVQAQMVVTGKTYQFLAVSKPVVIGKTKIKEDFEDKKNCILVEQANAHAITQAIFWAKNNPDELQKIAKSGHKLFQDKYSEKNISRILAGIV
ncbi:glycosyltransferase [Candidatus Parcubacteria bacterium]|nr:glycosyltransferase [Candidatus Parcubacteria bacterium]